MALRDGIMPLMANQSDGGGGLRELRSRALRDGIALASGRVLAAKGFSGSSILDFAGASGVTKNQLLHYFHSKEEIAAAALELARSAFRNEIAQPALSFADPRSRMGQAARLLAEHACTPGGSLALLAAVLRERALLPGALSASVDALAAELHSLLRTLSKGLKTMLPVDPAIPEVELSLVPPVEVLPAVEAPRARQLASAGLALLLGAATLAQEGPDDASGRRLTVEVCAQSLQRLLERG